ncbi:acyl-CoA N-acyltransferase [Aspergillus carlsbadensis]|nr:acyl-CoA N-acyltransferase [Aspergillus carlsbadensis]
MASQHLTPYTPPDPFRSQRLIYRAAEDNEEDQKFIHEHLNEPAKQLLSTMVLPHPRTKVNAAHFLAAQQARLLGVIICLPPDETGTEPEPNPGGAGDSRTRSVHELLSSRKPIPIGRLSLRDTMGAGTQHHRNAIMGISITDSARGKGYGREAINWALDWAFEIAGLHRVSLEVLSTNEGALGLYRSIGFVEEGRQREAIWQFRKWHDVVILGMLEGEWLRLRGREE